MGKLTTEYEHEKRREDISDQRKVANGSEKIVNAKRPPPVIDQR